MNHKFKKIEPISKRKIEERLQKSKLLDLSNQYSDYIKIVNDTATEMFEKLNTLENIIEYDVKLRNDLFYLNSFENFLKQVSENFVEGPQDSFIIAACLMYSLIDSKRVSFKINSQTPNNMVQINYAIALNVALKVIATPLVYEQNTKGEYVPFQLECVKIVLPDKDIKLENFKERTIKTLILNDIYGNEYDPLSFSLLLQMIYFNSLK